MKLVSKILVFLLLCAAVVTAVHLAIYFEFFPYEEDGTPPTDEMIMHFREMARANGEVIPDEK